MASIGDVRILCPVCHLEAVFPLTMLPELRADHDEYVVLGTVVLDLDAVMAHLLTHGPNDGGEPVPVAA